MFDSQFGGFHAFTQKFAYLFGLIDCFESFANDDFLSRAKILPQRTHWSDLSYWTYTQSIVRWRRILIYLNPKLQHVLVVVERFYRYLCIKMFQSCDLVHRWPHKADAMLFVGVLYHQIKHLTKMEPLNLSAVDHLQLALQNLLKVFCLRIFDFDKSKKVKLSKELNLPDENDRICGEMILDCVPELSGWLPPHYQRVSSTRKLDKGHLSIFNPPASSLDLPACLLRRSHRSQSNYDNSQTNNCCCGWTFDSTPSSFLSFFGHCAPSFARYVHSGPHKISLEIFEFPLDFRRVMNTVFGGPEIDKSSLRKRMRILGGAVSLWLGISFCVIKHSRKDVDIEAIVKTPEGTVDHLTNNIRPHVFAYILMSALITCHDFLDSERKGELDTKNFASLSEQLYSMVSNRQSFKLTDFVEALHGIILGASGR